MQIEKIFIGGWYQRTTLHLTELWDFMKHLKAREDLERELLLRFRDRLELQKLSRESGPFEYISALTRNDISFRIYEDGLIVLEKDFRYLEKDFETLKDYFENHLSKAVSYVFSKGAPIPKELANIKTILPYILIAENAKEEGIKELFKERKEEIYSHLHAGGVEVWRSAGIIFINNLGLKELLRDIVEHQIFFREFKSQLHRYLQMHRNIWEKISTIKEQGRVRGNEITTFRNNLESYKKTIELIDARIKQMRVYVKTRMEIARNLKIDDYLRNLFEFKYETLLDTHEYIGHLWAMTQNYLNSAIQIFNELEQKSAKETLTSLRLVTTIGATAAILNYLTSKAFPKITFAGLIYFGLLLVLTWLINRLVSYFYQHQSYQIKDVQLSKEI